LIVAKRYLVFFALALTFAALNVLLPRFFPALQQKPAAKQDDAAKKKVGGGKEADKKPAEKDAEKNKLAQAEKKEPGEKAPATTDPTATDTEKKTTDEAKQPEEKTAPKVEVKPATESWVALGSVDPTDKNPYRMMVTLSSRGAAVHRVELSSERYLDLDNRSGYLGHLSARTADAGSGGGLLVQLVGPGTPAAEAGLQPGDVLQKLDGAALKNGEALRTTLEKTKPRQTVKLDVLRAGKPLSLSATLRRLPLSVTRPEIENYRISDRTPPPGFVDQPSLLLTLDSLNDQSREKEQAELPGVDLLNGHWELIQPTPAEVTQNPTKVWKEAAYKRTLPSGLELIKRYRLAELKPDEIANPDFPAYHLEFEIELRNTGNTALEAAYQLDGPTGLPIEGWWYGTKIGRGGAVGVRDFVGQWFGMGDPVMFGATTIADDEQDTVNDQSMMFAGVDAQYFSVVMIPKKKSTDEIWFEKVQGMHIGPKPDESANKTLTNITVRMLSYPVKLAPKTSVKHAFTVFAGPKKPKLVAQYAQPADTAYTLSELIYYGWLPWAVVAKIMTTILHAFYSVVQNYGIAIIMLTVLVRGCMFPLSRKQAMNMVKMQELKPEMDRIQAKYKTEMDKRSKAMQELFRKNNYNPMGGCVLMVLQLPIFLGLYRSLMIDVELRQAPLFSDAIRWCSNLAGPDMLWNWSSLMPMSVVKGEGFFGLGPYFNILPIITVGLFLFQQKMFMPPATDETTAMQQKMMKYMMVFMGLMFYKVASGLCLYFIASTLWGMAERQLLPKSKITNPAASDVIDVTAKPKPTSGGNGASGSSSKKKNKKN
jgi:YidC/Oxa1 family membrane protein insertase